jgi:hypothetical protein
MFENKSLLVSSTILSFGIIIGCYLLASQPALDVAETQNKAEEQGGIMLDLKEASQFLGISSEELEAIIFEEKTTLQTSGVFDGMMLAYIVIDKKKYFEKTKLLVWAQESASERRKYSGK